MLEIRDVRGTIYRFDANGVKSKNKCGKVVDCDFLNVRDKASTKGKVVEKIYKNAYVEILKTSGSWYQVKTESGKTGWVSSTYVTIQASTKGKVVEKIYKNAYVEILKTSGSWYQVKTESGKTGWVSSTYVTIPGETNAKAEAVLKVAKAQLGKPYKWGATGPN